MQPRCRAPARRPSRVLRVRGGPAAHAGTRAAARHARRSGRGVAGGAAHTRASKRAGSAAATHSRQPRRLKAAAEGRAAPAGHSRRRLRDARLPGLRAGLHAPCGAALVLQTEPLFARDGRERLRARATRCALRAEARAYGRGARAAVRWERTRAACTNADQTRGTPRGRPTTRSSGAVSHVYAASGSHIPHRAARKSPACVRVITEVRPAPQCRFRPGTRAARRALCPRRARPRRAWPRAGRRRRGTAPREARPSAAAVP